MTKSFINKLPGSHRYAIAPIIFHRMMSPAYQVTGDCGMRDVSRLYSMVRRKPRLKFIYMSV